MQPSKKVCITPLVKNRRYKMMIQLEREGEYFGLDEMKARRPEVYAFHVGKFHKEPSKFDKDMPIHEKLIYNQDFSTVEERVRQEMLDQGIEPQHEELQEEDSPEPPKDESIKFHDVKDINYYDFKEQDFYSDVGRSQEDEYEMEQFKNEMKRLFIDGMDSSWFDYSKCDQDDSLDDHVAIQRDLEEAYFNEDDEEE